MDKYNKINWKKGMKLSEQVFTDADNYWCSQLNALRQAVFVRHYGICNPNFLFEGEIVNDMLIIRNLICKAITPAGYYIDIHPNYSSIHNPVREIKIHQAQDLYAYIGVDPYRTIPVENQDSLESINCFINHPYSEPFYEIFTESRKNNIPPNACLIARFKNRAYDPEFIPPCISISMNDRLIGKMRAIQADLKYLQFSLIEKRKQRESYAFLDIFLWQVSSILTEVSEHFEDKPPVELFIAIRKILSAFLILDQINDSIIISKETIDSVNIFNSKSYDLYDIEACIDSGLKALFAIRHTIENISVIEIIPEPPVPVPEPEIIPEKEDKEDIRRRFDLKI